MGRRHRHSDYIPFKWTLKDYKDFLIHQVSKRDIKVVLNTRVTPDMVAGRYDAVIAAVGAQPVVPNIPGVDGANVTVATDAIMNAGKIGDQVVVIGGGEVGVETGMYFAQMGKEVTVIEMRDELAADTTFMHYRSMFQAAWEAIPTFHYVLNATAKAITPDHVTYTDKDGVDHDLPPVRHPVRGYAGQEGRGSVLLRRGRPLLYGGRLLQARHHPDHQPQCLCHCHEDLRLIDSQKREALKAQPDRDNYKL